MDPVVAQIVADTMNGYIMFKRILKCEVVPPEKIAGCFIPPNINRRKPGPDAQTIQVCQILGIFFSACLLFFHFFQEYIDLKKEALKGENIGQYTPKQFYYLKSFMRQEGRMRQRIEKLQIPYRYVPSINATNM